MALRLTAQPELAHNVFACLRPEHQASLSVLEAVSGSVHAMMRSSPLGRNRHFYESARNVAAGAGGIEPPSSALSAQMSRLAQISPD